MDRPSGSWPSTPWSSPVMRTATPKTMPPTTSAAISSRISSPMGRIVARWLGAGDPGTALREEATMFRLGSRVFEDADYAVMAIVNRTPNSFFDKGATFAEDAALRAVDQAVTDGADIIDIGGVKAGPGVTVDPGEELRRTVPTVAAVRARFPDVVISIDTWRAEVAREAIKAGADLINDTWAGADAELAMV